VVIWASTDSRPCHSGLWFPREQTEGRITLLPILEPIESLNSPSITSLSNPDKPDFNGTLCASCVPDSAGPEVNHGAQTGAAARRESQRLKAGGFRDTHFLSALRYRVQ